MTYKISINTTALTTNCNKVKPGKGALKRALLQKNARLVENTKGMKVVTKCAIVS